MRKFAQTRRLNSLVGKAQPAPKLVVHFNPPALRRSFQGWLGSETLPEETLEDVSEEAMTASPHRAPQSPLVKTISGAAARQRSLRRTARPDRLRLLTTQDFIKVMLVTLRESVGHRPWPPEVVATFLAAEVIRPDNGNKCGRNIC